MFRQVPNVVAFYEPLHEQLPALIKNNVPIQSRHFFVDDYFREYPPLKELEHYHAPEFGVCDLHLEANDEYPLLKKYIQYLIDTVPSDKTPVLQFNRIDFRLSWIRTNFPDALLIHLYRGSRDQWISTIEHHQQRVEKDLDADPYRITTWSKDLCRQFPFLASNYIQHLYQRHYYLWKLSYLAGSRLSDLSLAYEDILQLPDEKVSQILSLSELKKTNAKDLRSVIEQRPLGRWKQYRDAPWFDRMEDECETTLEDTGLNADFGIKRLSEIISRSEVYSRLINNTCHYEWLTRTAQLDLLNLWNSCDDKEREIKTLQKGVEDLERIAEEQLQIIVRCSSLRQRLKWWLAPRLGIFYQYPARPLHIPAHYRSAEGSESLPTISMVTPSFNQVEFLKRTIESVLEQNYAALEYIIQDGGSEDGTVALLKKYKNHLSHWESGSDRGQTHAINLGFSHATGEIMAYLNSDDLLLPGALHYVGNYFSRHPGVDVVYGHRVLIDKNGLEVGRWVLPPHDNDVLSSVDYIPQETLFWRRRVWERAGGHVDETFRFAMDWDLILRLRDAGAKFVRLPRFLGAFRVHPEQKSSEQLEGRGWDEMRRIRRRCHNRDVSNEEIHRNIRMYLLKHVILNKLYRGKVLRY
jgi:glycosyltransferase involved in cell wall biosynthesis